ncbi:hypothetical protein TKK_0000834 [Trichogramma kaykai]
MKVLLALCAVAYLVTVSANNFSSVEKQRIVQGYTASHGQFPFQAHMKRRGWSKSWFPSFLVGWIPTWFASDFFCGASIINQRYLLTAAHCIFEKLFANELRQLIFICLFVFSYSCRENSEQWQQTDVVVGTNLVGQANATIYQVDRFIIHGDFISLDSSRWDRGINDIALVRVTKDIVYNEYVQPIRLAAKDHKLHEGSIVTITGWGKLSNTYEGSSKSLQMISRKVSNFRECKKQWMYMHEIPLDDGILCTVDILPTDQGGICKGDSGSPLVDENGIQVGIATISDGCGLTHIVPEGYTKVSHYADWIEACLKRDEGRNLILVAN